MRFITEENLRYQFSKCPFDEYWIEKENRLTPSARQFLTDRRISIREGEKKENLNQSEKTDLKNEKVVNCLEILAAEFLITVTQIADQDIETAEQILNIKKEISKIPELLLKKKERPNMKCNGCYKLNEQDCCKDNGNCFEISDFYISSAKGKVLVQINALRAKTRAVRIELTQMSDEYEEKEGLNETVIFLNQVINKLSHLMCKAAEVKECHWIR